MKLTLHEQAQEEGRQQVSWYASRDPRIAHRLELLLVDAVERIATNPFEFPLLEIRRNAGDIRRVRIKGFPLMVIYQVSETDVLVVAVTHTSRRPGYWRSRLKKL